MSDIVHAMRLMSAMRQAIKGLKVALDTGKDIQTQRVAVRVCGRCNNEFAGDACPCGFMAVKGDA
jgi:hypothetical protein